MSFVRRFAETNTAQFAANALQLVVSILIARGLGVTGKGAYSAATAIIEVVIYLGLLGINNGLVYYAARGEREARAATTLALIFTATNGAAAAALTVALALFPNPLARNVAPAHLYAVAPLALASIGVTYLSSVEIAREHIRLYNALTVLAPVAQLLGLFGILAAGRVTVTAALLVLTGSGFAVLLAYAAHTLARVGLARPTRHEARHILTVGLRSYLIALLSYIVLRSDIVILNILRGNYEVGLYSTATALAFKFLLVSSSVTVLLSPRSIREPEKSLDFHLLVMRVLSFLIGSGLALTDLLYVPVVSILYGAAFVPSWQPYALLNPGVYFLCLHAALAPYYMARGYPPVSILAAAIAAVSNVLMNLAVVSRFGYNGAAVASSVSYFLAFAIYAYDIKRREGVRVSEMLVPRRDELLELWERMRGAARATPRER